MLPVNGRRPVPARPTLADRLDHARQAGVRSRLIANGIREADVDRWPAAWEAEAPLPNVQRESSDHWNAGAFWIESQVKVGARVPM